MPSAGTEPTQLPFPRVSFAGHKERKTGNKLTFHDFMIDCFGGEKENR
jgi:hypothetical protein